MRRKRVGSAADAGGELPAVGAEIAGVVEAGVLFGNGHAADAAGTGDKIASGILERPI